MGERSISKYPRRALHTEEEESFIDFTSSGEIKRQFCNKTLFQFWAEVDDEFSELKTKAFRILLPFSTSYLCETGFSAVAALKTKYRSQLNIEKELRVSISNIKPSFEKPLLCETSPWKSPIIIKLALKLVLIKLVIKIHCAVLIH
ncbi:zinc finger BED domain-containing protein 5 [Trichonephila clavipes]|nr:zinc finger BED domain-containing protein 5 [Trichonephila clavipes]